MTTIVEKDSSGLAAVSDYSLSKEVQTLPDCVTGGYSVWDCPPPMEPKLPTPAKRAL